MATLTLSVSSVVKSILPDALIEYLWKIVLGGDWGVGESRWLTVKANKLSGRDVLDILFEDGGGREREYRRVFGVDPLNCKLQVQHTPDSYEMLLADF